MCIRDRYMGIQFQIICGRINMDDDWEALADADVNDIKVKKADQFADEEDAKAITLLDEDKPKESAVQSQPKNVEKEKKKNKAKELEEKFEQKAKTLDNATTKKGPLTWEEKKQAEILSQKSDMRNIVDAFGGVDIGSEQADQNALISEEDYLSFARKIAEKLVLEEKKLFIQEFMKELLNGLQSRLTSKEYQEIYNKCLVLFNQKQKEEKGPEKGKKKKAPALNAKKSTTVTKVGDEFDDFGGEDEEYGEYTGRFDDEFM
eukprot:TRINITY_DN1768_c0_g1_i16.p1 TRINITY_DN1768_c0_g1~~TRINITY_DN1768_c0_g1_i16.p1  ORF type:complete len:261 (+),score=91.24 TRINITY_DN1768_c0_g1_i16:67-849(+)